MKVDNTTSHDFWYEIRWLVIRENKEYREFKEFREYSESVGRIYYFLPYLLKFYDLPFLIKSPSLLLYSKISIIFVG